jgi:hypothetical protein
VLAANDMARALFAAGMGTSDVKKPRGLATNGALAVPLRGGGGDGGAWGVLFAHADGALAIEDASEAPAPEADEDFAELPLLLFDGATYAGDARTTTSLRSALGVTPEGRVVIARANAASDAPLTEALELAGCTRAVMLDRGSHAEPLFDRASATAAPRDRYDETVVYALGATLEPRGFRFDATAPAAFKPPSWTWPF